MSDPLFQRAAVVGVGLIGGSVALAIRERGVAASVVGVCRSERSAKRALDSGVVAEATADWDKGCRGADLVVLCTPVGDIPSLVLASAERAEPGALITDAGSTKAEIVAAAEAAGEPTRCFVGAHPLAGDHQTGPEAARADLFEGAVTVITPGSATATDVLSSAEAFWAAIGSRVITMSPAEHDKALAATSHTPHLAAAAVAAATPAELLPLAATGWADTTRVAAGSPTLWREILLANRLAVVESLGAVVRELADYAEAIQAADGERIERMLEQGKLRREAYGRGDDLGD